MLKVRVVPEFASLAVGLNEYAAPAATVVTGTPEITGGVSVTGFVIEKAGSCRV